VKPHQAFPVSHSQTRRYAALTQTIPGIFTWLLKTDDGKLCYYAIIACELTSSCNVSKK